jgi:hexosaminidase
MLAPCCLKVSATLLIIASIAACAQQDHESAHSAASVASSISILPAPRELQHRSGSFRVTAGTPVFTSGHAQEKQAANYLVDLLARSSNLSLTQAQASNDAEKGVRFALRNESNAAKGAYTLTVSSNGILVESGTASGLFYGAVTVWQLVTAGESVAGGVDVPVMTIKDAPRFSWRGLMIDSARHFQTLEELKQIVDIMALHKMNVLHWHLTDDQGWRLEIKKYPKLTSIGAWRVPAGAGPAADIDPATGKARLYGGYYTQDEARELVAYAATRHITVVPEIEMPGHASAAIAAYPQLGVIGLDGQVPADWGIYENLFNVEESTFAFLEDVLSEAIAVFPGEYIHVGGDEAVKKQWESSPRVQQRMKELGVKDAHALQSYFIQRMEKFLNGQGRRLIGWDEILEGGLAPNATVMSWRGIDGAVAAATAGHDAVLAPWPTLYFDNRPLDTAKPPGRGRVISVEDVYRFDPVPTALTPAQRKHILGVQANVWTEHIRTFDRLQYMVLPRLAALSEVAWSDPEHIDWQAFSARLTPQLARYERLGLRFADAQAVEAPTGTRRSSHQLKACSDKLPLSLEDDAPVRGERAVFFVDIMQPCWIYEDAALAKGTALRANVGQVPFNFQIGDDINEIPLRDPSTAFGELEVRLDSCDGERIATVSLATAVDNPTVTALPPVSLGNRAGTHDLCLTFTQAAVDPTWVIDTVELIEAGATNR